jgi:DNA-binding MarR family transcriptional regulator
MAVTWITTIRSGGRTDGRRAGCERVTDMSRDTAAMREEGRDFQATMMRVLSGSSIEGDEAAATIVWHLLRIVRHVETKLDFEVHRPQGWSWSGFRVMVNLYVEGSLEPSALATVLNVSRPTITNLLERLEENGFVTRTPHPTNRSRVLVDLTEAGRTAVETTSAAQHKGEIDIVASLTRAEQAQLARLLEKLYVGLRNEVD